MRELSLSITGNKLIKQPSIKSIFEVKNDIEYKWQSYQAFLISILQRFEVT